MKSLKFALPVIVATFLPFISLAHEGHGIVNDNSWMHYFTSSEHLGTIVVGLIAIVAFVAVYRNKKAASGK